MNAEERLKNDSVDYYTFRKIPDFMFTFFILIRTSQNFSFDTKGDLNFLSLITLQSLAEGVSLGKEGMEVGRYGGRMEDL